MFSLGTSEFVKNIRRYIVVIFQIAAVYMLAIFSVSAFMEQYSMWDGIGRFFDDTGVILNIESDMPTDMRPTEDNLKRDLIKVENIVTTYRYTMYGGEVEEGAKFDFTMLTYDKEMVTFVPKLIEGVWCEDYEHTDNIYNIVIPDDFPIDIEVGETFVYNRNTFRVTGIYDDVELTISYSAKLPLESSHGSYMDYYQSVEAMNTARIATGAEKIYVTYGSYEDVKREDIEYTSNGIITIDYCDDITKEEMEENEKTLFTVYGYSMNMGATYTEPIYDYSLKLIAIKVLPMMIIFVIVFILSSVSLINAGAVNVLREKRNYGIYFICGNNWKKTIGISLVNWLCIVSSGLIIAISTTLLLKSSGKLDKLALSLSTELVLVMIAITIVLLIMALILPYNMFKKLQPVNILKDNDK